MTDLLYTWKYLFIDIWGDKVFSLCVKKLSILIEMLSFKYTREPLFNDLRVQSVKLK